LKLLTAREASTDDPTRRALLADGHLHRGNLRMERQQPARAAEDFREAVALYDRLHKENSAEPAYPYHLASVNNSLASALLVTAPARAAAALDRAATLLQPLTEQYDKVAGYPSLLGQVRRNRAVLRFLQTKPGPQAEESYRQVEKELRESERLLGRL